MLFMHVSLRGAERLVTNICIKACCRGLHAACYIELRGMEPTYLEEDFPKVQLEHTQVPQQDDLECCRYLERIHGNKRAVAGGRIRGDMVLVRPSSLKYNSAE